MIIYGLPFLTLLYFSYHEIFTRKYNKKLESIVLGVLILYLIIIAGIRFKIGVDYKTYLDMFRGIYNFRDYDYLEFGFRYIIAFFKQLGLPPQFFFALFAFLTLYPLKKILEESSHFPIFSLFIYLCIFYTAYVFNVMRQGIAMTIFLFSFKYILNNEIKMVILLTLVAISFHFSGIIIFFSYLITRLRINFSQKDILLILISFTIFSFFSSYFIKLFLFILPPIVSNKILSFANRFEGSVTIIGLAQRLLIIAPLLYHYKKLINVDNDFKKIFFVYVFGYILYCTFSFQELFITRINMFFRILEIILIPYLFRINLKINEKKLIYVLFVIWGFMVYVSVFNKSDYFPYRSILLNILN